MDHIIHEVRLTQWKKSIGECHARPKRQTSKSWLAERVISENSFYYW